MKRLYPSYNIILMMEEGNESQENSHKKYQAHEREQEGPYRMLEISSSLPEYSATHIFGLGMYRHNPTRFSLKTKR